MKKCCTCRLEKPLTDFWRDGGNKDGLYAKCKLCALEYKAQNREHIREYARKYAKWWKANNKDRYQERQTRRLKRAATAPGGPFSQKREDYRARVRYYGHQCAYCQIEKAQTLDHAIPLSRGGCNWPANVYPACFKCNQTKSSKKLYSEWTPPVARKA